MSALSAADTPGYVGDFLCLVTADEGREFLTAYGFTAHIWARGKRPRRSCEVSWYSSTTMGGGAHASWCIAGARTIAGTRTCAPI